MSNKSQEEGVRQALAELTTTFGNKIPDKAKEISKSWGALKSSSGTVEQYNLVHRQIHSLAGTASTYGFIALGQHARTMETILAEELGEDRSLWNVLIIEKMDHCMEALMHLSQNVFYSNGPDVISFPPLDVMNQVDDNSLIYFVDDDEDFLHSMAMQIKSFGYEVAIFTDLTEFESALAQKEPAIVIMDVMFGEGDWAGIDHIFQINLNRKAPLKTIFISGKGDISTRLRAVKARSAAFFSKPFKAESLVDTLERITHSTISPPLRVVIVDDAPEMSRFAAIPLLQAGMEIREVNEPLLVLSVLDSFNPDLILMDIYMPSCSGLELSKVIRQIDAYVSTPIVFFSMEQDLKKQLGAMSLGGDDFLTKPIEPWHLVSAIASRAKRGRVMRKLAQNDSLTGLLNHTSSKERLETELIRAKREQIPLSFAMLDIDHFKKVNDIHGHSAGDRVLKNLANMLRQRLRKSDIIGRYGGEEFVIILPDTPLFDAEQIMNGLRVNFSEITHHAIDGAFHCYFSCGVAAYPDMDSSNQISEEVDKALYLAKEAGRNCVKIARSAK